jgi:hypothetical protein
MTQIQGIKEQAQQIEVISFEFEFIIASCDSFSKKKNGPK